MHRGRALSGRRGAAATAVALLALAGCGERPVRAVPFDASDSLVCQEVAQVWPESVGPYEPRVTAVQSDGVAAWGDPPIVARCGKAAPGPTTDPCIDVAGVDWVATVLDDGGTMFTTYGREPALEVLVPADYDSHPLLLPPFDDAARVVPQTSGECSSPEG
ncbi:DUF3515 family protein [Serinicoccus kebangsaanensis]|uniref:DUF3515 family protein n=1 Tax=Serinicoccus kebangsaanensis TaxID=2602069 RepID=UPI00124F0718|nr:DUF3515 family protein [Serinicoccus kebangsaanensis]